MLTMLHGAFAAFPSIKQVLLFGSRSMNTYREGSDIDICLKGDEISSGDIQSLRLMLEDTLPIPYFFDIVLYKKIKNDALKEHIDTFGQELYKSS